ncbi:hypothetical protein [Archangium sp.]|uniref:hypothetical protein n=1 Tax=Archangium sp. TaxID=1872627 RepID=UPI00286CF5DA|nr:hypothetical protein [Archangium sp.]
MKTPDSRTLVNLALGVCGLLLCVAVGALVTAPEPAALPAQVTEPRPLAMASAQAQPAPAPSEPPVAQAPPEPTEAPEQPSLEALVPRSATYPVDSLRLDARRDVFRVSPRFAAIARLEVGERYLVRELNMRPEHSPLFFLLMGDGLKADESVGTLTTQPLPVARARAALFFTVGLVEGDAQDVRTVEVVNERTSRSYTVSVVPSHARTSLERAFALKGLDGMATYQLALGSGGAGAYTQGTPKGPVRKVACARKTSDGPIRGRILDEFSHAQQFLVSEGSPVEVRGASALWCGFIDDVDPRDNQGELELFITQVATAKPWVRGSESPERLHADAQALMRKQRFAEAEPVLEKCIEADHHFALCYQLMAVSKARRYKMDEAVRYYRRFAELAPDHPSTPDVKKLVLEYDRQRR